MPALSVGFAAHSLPFAFGASRSSSMEAERAASWAFRFRGLVAAALGAAFGAMAIFSPPIFAEAQWERVPLEIVGWLVFFAGAGLRFWATLYIGGRKRLVVVNEGPYSICRNPLYLGTFLIAFSVAVILQSLTFLACVLVGAVFYAWATVPAEERYLSRQLGDAYGHYCREVPRWHPLHHRGKRPRAAAGVQPSRAVGHAPRACRPPLSAAGRRVVAALG
jgi:protein-S-isoprenylcysteine O-methyltransferase Ste14